MAKQCMGNITIDLGNIIDNIISGYGDLSGLRSRINEINARADATRAECEAAGGVVKAVSPLVRDPMLRARGFVCAMPPSFSPKVRRLSPAELADYEMAEPEDELGFFIPAEQTCPPGFVEEPIPPEKMSPTIRRFFERTGRVPIKQCVVPRGMRGIELGIIPAPPVLDPANFALGITSIPSVVEFGAKILAVKDLVAKEGISPLLTRGVAFGATLLGHIAMGGTSSFLLGAVIGQVPGLISLLADQVATAIAESIAAKEKKMPGIDNYNVGQLTAEELEELRKIREELTGAVKEGQELEFAKESLRGIVKETQEVEFKPESLRGINAERRGIEFSARSLYS
jgi:hypothetical protein